MLLRAGLTVAIFLHPAWAQGHGDVIGAIKRVQQDLGYGPTKNFSVDSPGLKAYYYCYYTAKLSLPASYEGLRFERGSAQGCRIDEAQFDVFFYPIEAVASGSTPVTGSLTAASLERVAVVVSHEDFHVQDSVQRLPEPIAEAASTLVGFLTAAEYARSAHGENSEAYRTLAGEAGIFLRKAGIINAWHSRLTALYSWARRQIITEDEALSEKSRLLAELRNACESLNPAPVSFNRCPAVLNNAGLAFDMTYTRYYPLMYELYLTAGRDTRTTIDMIRQVAAKGATSEAGAVERFRQQIRAIESGAARPTAR